MKKPAILLLLAFALATSSCNRITEAEQPPPPDGEASVTIRISADSAHWSDSTWREGGVVPQVERRRKAWFRIELDGDYVEVDSLIVRWGDGRRSTLSRGRVLGHTWVDTGSREITAAVWIDGYALADTSFPIRIVNMPPRPGLRDFLGGRTEWDIDSTLTYLRPAATEGTEKTFFDFDVIGKTPIWDDTVAAGAKASWKWPVPGGADTTRSVRIVERVVDDLGAEASDTIPLVLRVAPPRITLRAAADTVGLGDTIRVSAHPSAPRGLDTLAWNIDGAAKSAAGRDSVLAFPATRSGILVISAQAVDARGVRGPADTLRIHVRGTLAIESIAGPDSAFLRDTVELTAQAATDAPQGIAWTWKIGGEVVGSGASIRHAFQKPESLQVTAIATIAGLPSDSLVRTLRIVDRAPVVDSVTGVRALLAHQVTRLCARAHDPDRDTISWRWFRAGSSSVLSTSACFEFAPTDTGRFDFLVKAGDPWGKFGSKSVRIEVGPNRLAVDAGDSTTLNYGQPLARLGTIATDVDTAKLAARWIVVLPAKDGSPDGTRLTHPGRAFPDTILRTTPGRYLAIFEALGDSLGLHAADTAAITVINRPLRAVLTRLDPADSVLAQDDTLRLAIRVVDEDSAIGGFHWKWYDEADDYHLIERQEAPSLSISSGTLVDTLVWPVREAGLLGKATLTAHVWDTFNENGYAVENTDILIEPRISIEIVDSMPGIDLWDPNPVVADSLRDFRSCFALPPGRSLIRYEWSLDDTVFSASSEYQALASSVSSGWHVLRLTVADDAGNTTTDSISFVAARRIALPDTVRHEAIDRFTVEHPFVDLEALCGGGALPDHPLGQLKIWARDAKGGTVQTANDGSPEDPLLLSGSSCSERTIAVFRPTSGSYDLDPDHPAAGFNLVVDNGIFKDTAWMALPIRYIPSPPTIAFEQPPPQTIAEGEELSLLLKIAPPADAPEARWELRIDDLPGNTRIGSNLADMHTRWSKRTGYPFLDCPSVGPCRIPMDSLNGELRIDLDTNFDGDLGILFQAVALEPRGLDTLASNPADLVHKIHVVAVASQPNIYAKEKDIFVPESSPVGMVELEVSSGTQDSSERIDTLRIECDPALGSCPPGIQVMDALGRALESSPTGGWIYAPLIPAPPGTYSFTIELPVQSPPSSLDVVMKATATIRENSNGSSSTGAERFTIHTHPSF